jgi:hypothetical protein
MTSSKRFHTILHELLSGYLSDIKFAKEGLLIIDYRLLEVFSEVPSSLQYFSSAHTQLSFGFEGKATSQLQTWFLSNNIQVSR